MLVLCIPLRPQNVNRKQTIAKLWYKSTEFIKLVTPDLSDVWQATIRSFTIYSLHVSPGCLFLFTPLTHRFTERQTPFNVHPDTAMIKQRKKSYCKISVEKLEILELSR